MNIREKIAWLFSTSFVVMALFAILVPIAHADDVTEEWVARYDGAGIGQDLAHAIATDSAGNVYVTGSSWGGETHYDFATAAYDSLGNQLWLARYNAGDEVDSPTAIATDNAGNVYVTGYSQDGRGPYEYATVAYDSFGNQLWVARYVGSANRGAMPSAIATDSAGNVYVTGYSLGLGTGTDYATVAYDSLGNQLWVARYNGSANSSDQANAIAIDSAGNVCVTGFSYGSETAYDYAYLAYDYATVVYDSFGKQLWVARYNGPTNSGDKANAIATDSSGNVYVTGTSKGFERHTDTDYATVAYDSLGNQLWVARYTFGRNDEATAIATDSAGNVYVTGSSWSYWSDYATVAYDSLGNQLWVARYDAENFYDYAKAIAIDSSDNVYVTGSSMGTNGAAYATVAYDSFGNQIWVARYNGPETGDPLSDYATAIATDSAGNVYVTGYIRDWVAIGSTSVEYGTVKYSQGVQNDPPLAEAGVNQTVECTGASGTILTLDGSGSTDPDGDALTYIWSGPFGTEIGATATVTLPLGTHTITLTVDDGMGGSATDNVEVMVEDTTPPIMTKAILSGTELLPEIYLSDVLFEMEATDTCSGVAHVSYVLDGIQAIVSGDYASVTISSGGDHTIFYNAMDNAGNISATSSLALSLFEANVSGLSGLIDYFLAQGLIDSEMETSLDRQATTGAYDAVINHVEAQSGKKIDPVAAQVLIEAAQSIMGN